MLMRLLVLRANRWLASALALSLTASLSYGQVAPAGIPVSSTKSLNLLRGPPIQQRPPDLTLAVPIGFTINNNGTFTTTFFSTGVPQHVALYPNHNNITALNNGSIQPGFVYNLLPPSAVGGTSGGIGGGGISGGISGGIGGIGGGISGGIGGIGGGISGGIGGIGGGISGGIGGIGGGISGGIGGIGGIGGGVGGFGGFAYPLGGSIGGGNSFQGGNLNAASSGIAGGSATTVGFGGFGGGFGGVMGALGGRGF